MSKNLKGTVFLLITALFWGSTFVAQEMAAKQFHIGAFTYQSMRMFVGSLSLLPVIAVSTHLKKKSGTYKKTDKKDKKQLLSAGIICGTVLCVASCLQQIALQDKNTGSGKIAFITALYILLVPVINFFLGHKIDLKTVISIGLGMVGLYFLSIKPGSFSISEGDFYGILCALIFSAHILFVDYFAPKVDPVKLSALQFFVCGAIALIPTLLIEKPLVSDILNCYGPILYAGIFSCGIAYTFQIFGQKYTNPATASVLMSLESPFGVLSGLVVMNIAPSTAVWLKAPDSREWIGCIIMFFAIILSQLPLKKLRISKKQ